MQMRRERKTGALELFSFIIESYGNTEAAHLHTAPVCFSVPLGAKKRHNTHNVVHLEMWDRTMVVERQTCIPRLMTTTEPPTFLSLSKALLFCFTTFPVVK